MTCKKWIFTLLSCLQFNTVYSLTHLLRIIKACKCFCLCNIFIKLYKNFCWKGFWRLSGPKQHSEHGQDLKVDCLVQALSKVLWRSPRMKIPQHLWMTCSSVGHFLENYYKVPTCLMEFKHLALILLQIWRWSRNLPPNAKNYQLPVLAITGLPPSFPAQLALTLPAPPLVWLGIHSLVLAGS